MSVPSYEAWNLQYEQLVGKAAKDFAPVPGLATSWTGLTIAPVNCHLRTKRRNLLGKATFRLGLKSINPDAYRVSGGGKQPLPLRGLQFLCKGDG